MAFNFLECFFEKAIVISSSMPLTAGSHIIVDIVACIVWLQEVYSGYRCSLVACISGRDAGLCN